jgi:hypothetical protein
MNGKKVIAISWWTFAYVVAAGTLLTFSAIGDCLQGAQGAACRDQSNTVWATLLVALVLAYGLLTWLMFFRRR